MRRTMHVYSKRTTEDKTKMADRMKNYKLIMGSVRNYDWRTWPNAIIINKTQLNN